MLRPGSLEGERKGQRRLRLVPLTKGERELRMAAGLNKRATEEQRNKQSGQNDAPLDQENTPGGDKPEEIEGATG